MDFRLDIVRKQSASKRAGSRPYLGLPGMSAGRRNSE
jgi:hypothetical protein